EREVKTRTKRTMRTMGLSKRWRELRRQGAGGTGFDLDGLELPGLPTLGEQIHADALAILGKPPVDELVTRTEDLVRLPLERRGVPGAREDGTPEGIGRPRTDEVRVDTFIEHDGLRAQELDRA